MLLLGSMYDRDLIMGHASNLSEDHLIELVIPDYLQSLKKFLDRFAYRVRKRARDIHETRFSTAIRMDDEVQSLFLAVREQGEEDWMHYTKEEIEDMDGDLTEIRGGFGNETLNETVNRPKQSTPMPQRSRAK